MSDNPIQSFQDLTVWQKAHELVIFVYKTSNEYPESEKYNMVSQLQRAAVSITANISEGFARYHYKDKAKFYYNARGSLAEVENLLILSRDLDYLSKSDCDNLLVRVEEVGKLINGLIRSTIQNS